MQLYTISLMVVILGYTDLLLKILITLNHVLHILALIRKFSLESIHSLKTGSVILERFLMRHIQLIEIVTATKHMAYNLMPLEM